MVSLLDRPIQGQDWQREAGAIGSPIASRAAARNGPAARKDQREDERWEAVVNELVRMQHLGDNWDGLGATAPSGELLASAVGLAYLFKEDGVEAPTRVVPATDGAVIFEWQFADGSYGEIEVIRPLFAEAMLVEPGKPARHWVLPNA